MDKIRYCILDPTGNITAMVETPVPVAMQPDAAQVIMKKHAEVEQVGFVQYHPDAAEDEPQVTMRMAGGEFCGNATMSAAALCALRNLGADCADDGEVPVIVKASGVDAPLVVRLAKADGDAPGFLTSVEMPPAYGIEEKHERCKADWMTIEDDLPVVHMQGIDHIILEQTNLYYGLRNHPQIAEAMIKKLCARWESECLGMMFYYEGEEEKELLPLVYVPGADTVFWENSCASGTAASGIYLAAEAGAPVDIPFKEPGGTLRVASDPATGCTVLHGSAKLIYET